jgi:type IV pilus assembly protein PilY1
MNFYAVTLNTRGLQFNVPGVQQNPYITKPLWPDNFPPRHPSAVDDLWHATINGRGKLLNATSPKDISTQLRSVLSSVVEKTASAAAAAVNGGVVNTNSLVFQPRFDSSDWSGQLLSYKIDTRTGLVRPGTMIDSANKIPAANLRKIFTRTSAGAPVEFVWANLQADKTRVAQLDSNSNAVAAENMLNYLRGDKTNEGLEPGKYRPRTTALGDIVNSAPLFVGAPPFRYRDSLEADPYSAFATAKMNRPAMVYVGANDGMLHAFNADATSDTNRGREVFAYIPGAVFPNLSALASQSYGHKFYVDAPPSMGDAYFARSGDTGASWRTVLVGGLNKGGQGVYALDITNPGSFSENNVLWEFTDANDADLGFTFSQPTIAKLRDGKWYAVFGNGYNSRLADGRPSTTGSAVLFIVDLGTGEARKIDTREGFAQRGEPANALDQAITYDNGLATPALIDTNGDRIVEYAYAGDLYGNMWKFDLTSTDPRNWVVAFEGAPLFKARNDDGRLQPITARPEVTRGPGGAGYMVLFGTGKYLEAVDKLLQPQLVNSFYGIVDRNMAAVTYTGLRSTVLTKQSILQEVPAVLDNELRVTTDFPLGANQGWYIDLFSPLRGYENEKQVTDAVVRDQRVIFTTLTPDTDPCGFGGTSWLMELDARDGSRLEISPFDVNNDGVFDTQDMVLTDLNDGNGSRPIPPGGIRKKLVGAGILSRPTIVTGEFGSEGKAVQYKYMPSSSGDIVVITENPGADSTGRQSWRQIR